MTYQTYIHFLPETGEIIGWVSDHTPPEGPGYMLSPTGGPVDGRVCYVVGGAVVPRPRMEARLFNRRITGLPVPCLITINDKPYECVESSVTLEFTYSGSYRVLIQAFPYVPIDIEVSQ